MGENHTVTRAPELGPDQVIETQSDLGPILLQRDAELVTLDIVRHGKFEPELTDLLRRALRPGMTFVDAGANIGWFSVLASGLVGPEGRVFSVEPDPLNLSILRANLERRGCRNATVLPVAAWSERTELRLKPSDAGGAGVSVGAPAATGDVVPAAPLDELIDGRVNVMKVDCESTDHVVVSGASRIISANPAIVITVEFATGHTSHTGDTPDQILATYRDLGLHPYRIVEGRGLRPTSFERIATAGPPYRPAIFNFALSRALPPDLLGRPGAIERAQDLVPERYRGLVRRRTMGERRSVLEWMGDQLERVPQRWRPPIRRRDRQHGD
jgi:FkbM family methyltransferase